MLRWLKCKWRGHRMLYYGYGNNGIIHICERCRKTKIITPSTPYQKEK